MKLPFSHDQFLGVFAAYNERFLAVAGVLWFLTLVILFYVWRGGPRASQLVATLLAVQWAWATVAYHLALFQHINPVARVFAALFLLESAILVWFGVVRRALAFSLSRSVWTILALALAVYALAYPFLGSLTGLSYPYMPTFGVPCPTTILTAGLLLLPPSRQTRLVSAIPLGWAAVGSTAAFALAIPADLALVPAGALLLFRNILPGGRRKEAQ